MKTKIKVTPEQQAWVEARGNRPWTAVLSSGYPYKNTKCRLISLHNNGVHARREASARNSLDYPMTPARAVGRDEFLVRFEMVVEVQNETE